MDYLGLHQRTTLRLYSNEVITNIRGVEILVPQLWLIQFIWYSLNALLPMMT